MSVQEGSAKETYESAIEYWQKQISKYQIDVQEAQHNLNWAIDGLNALFKQYKKEYP